MSIIGCNCGSGKKRTVRYVVKYTSGGESSFGTLRDAQEDLQAHDGAGRISKVRS